MRPRSAPAGSTDAAKTGMAATATPSREAWAYTQDSATRAALLSARPHSVKVSNSGRM